VTEGARASEAERGLSRYLRQRREARQRCEHIRAGRLIVFAGQTDWLEEDVASAAAWLGDHVGQRMQVEPGGSLRPRPRQQLWLIETVERSAPGSGWLVHIGDDVWPLQSSARCWRFTRTYRGGEAEAAWTRATLLVEHGDVGLSEEHERFFVEDTALDPSWVVDEVVTSCQ
jgi:hypothetical protein